MLNSIQLLFVRFSAADRGLESNARGVALILGTGQEA